MTTLPIYQIDAFAAARFRGNPAAVVPLESWLDDARLQAIAAENNLAETAFFVPAGDAWALRWFTPACEVRLCGHATLASAWVLFEALGVDAPAVEFDTLSGRLRVRRRGDLLELDFPRWHVEPLDTPPADLVAGLGAPAAAAEHWIVTTGDNHFVVLDDEADVAALTPDFARLARLHPAGVIVTAPGQAADCVCRYFAPSYGIDEDAATGSIHCAIAPFWSERLGRPQIHSRQLSARGADLHCTTAGDRVRIAGRAVLYLEGTIHIQDDVPPP